MNTIEVNGQRWTDNDVLDWVEVTDPFTVQDVVVPVLHHFLCRDQHIVMVSTRDWVYWIVYQDLLRDREVSIAYPDHVWRNKRTSQLLSWLQHIRVVGD